jgi:hypothetical protein
MNESKHILPLYFLVVLLAIGVVYDSYRLRTNNPVVFVAPTDNYPASTTPKTSNPNLAAVEPAYTNINQTGPSGMTYQNTNFGLSLDFPVSWNGYTVQVVGSSFGGIGTESSFNFYLNESNTFTINVFTKEEWNKLRTEELQNNTVSYGEGDYLGENFTYIFSVIINSRNAEVQSILDTVRFY